jgi:hypothetical protein
MLYHRVDLENHGIILGNSFFENYYVLWDFDSKSIGFNGYFGSAETPKKKGGFPGWAIALLVIVGLASLGVIGWFLFQRYQEKKLRE